MQLSWLWIMRDLLHNTKKMLTKLRPLGKRWVAFPTVMLMPNQAIPLMAPQSVHHTYCDHRIWLSPIACGKDQTPLFHEIGMQGLKGSNNKHKKTDFKIALCLWLCHLLLDAGLLLPSVSSVPAPPLVRSRRDVQLTTGDTSIGCGQINATLMLRMQEFAL